MCGKRAGFRSGEMVEAVLSFTSQAMTCCWMDWLGGSCVGEVMEGACGFVYLAATVFQVVKVDAVIIVPPIHMIMDLPILFF